MISLRKYAVILLLFPFLLLGSAAKSSMTPEELEEALAELQETETVNRDEGYLPGFQNWTSGLSKHEEKEWDLILNNFEKEKIDQERLSKIPLPKSIEPRKPSFIDAKFPTKFPTLTSWVSACSSLVKNRDRVRDQKYESAFGQNPWIEFNGVLETFLTMMKDFVINRKDHWSISNNGDFEPTEALLDRSEPFAQKLIAQPEDQFFMRGDLHGDIYSLLEQLKDMVQQGVLDENFRIIPDRTWMVFLGDYVDRGVYGCEVLYTMMRLALANPDRVIFVRGNHEDVEINANYGFDFEVEQKFGKVNPIDSSKPTPFDSISEMYKYLPVVLYLGCKDTKTNIINYIQCCHGGIEIGYDPRRFLESSPFYRYQLLGELHFDVNLSNIKDSMPEGKTFLNKFSKKPNSLGLQWSDFRNDPNVATNFKSERGCYSFSKQDTEIILQYFSTSTVKLRGIIRAHQHDEKIKKNDPDNLMEGLIESNGVYKLWRPYEKMVHRVLSDGWVWTFNVGADTTYGKGAHFNFATYALIKTKPAYDDWTMDVYTQELNFASDTKTPKEALKSVSGAAAAAATPVFK